MIERKTIFVARRPELSRWQLASPLQASASLIGWRVSAEADRDSSVPDEVALLFARAIVGVARATFPSSSAETMSAPDVVRELRPTSFRLRMRLLLSGQRHHLRLVSTSNPDLVRSLFEDPAFPWWMQGQLVLIGQKVQLEYLNLECILELLDPTARIDAHELSALGVDACLRPGADGSVAALVSSNESAHAALMTAFEAQALLSDFAWRDLSDQQFVDALAEPWKQ